MKIGSYKKNESTEPQIEDKREKVETPQSNMAEGIQEEISSSVDRTEKTSEKAKTYKDILKEHNIPESRAQAIVDSILESGYFENAFSITKKVSVTFRTRTQEDYKRYLQALELHRPSYEDEMLDIQIRHYLTASIVAYKGKVFAHPSEDAPLEERNRLYQERLDWVDRQPERLVALLADKLRQFDDEVRVVLSEGVIENF